MSTNNKEFGRENMSFLVEKGALYEAMGAFSKHHTF